MPHYGRGLLKYVAFSIMFSLQAWAAGPDLSGAQALAVDSAHRQVLVLIPEDEANATARLLVLGLQGGLKAEHQLTGVAGQDSLASPYQLHFYPKIGTAVVVSRQQQKAWLVDVETGDVEQLAFAVSALAADVSRSRLFVSTGDQLRVLDLSRGKTVLNRLFARPIDDLFLSPDGTASFLLKDVACRNEPNQHFRCTDRFVSVEPSSFALSERLDTVYRDGEPVGDARRLLAVDPARGRYFLQREDQIPLEADYRWVTVEKGGSTGKELGANLPADDASGDGYARSLVAFSPSASYLYVQHVDADIECALGVYDAGTLRPVKVQRDFCDTVLTREAGGSLLVASGTKLQRRHARTVQVQKSAELGSAARLIDVDAKTRVAYLVLENGSLLRFDLESFKALP